MEIARSMNCEKHSGYEKSIFCSECKALFCLECCLEHENLNPGHKTISVQEMTIATIRKIEKDSEKLGSIDAVRQEIKGIENSLASKQIIAQKTAETLRTKLHAELEKCIETQIGLLTEMTKECLNLKEESSDKALDIESFGKNIELSKRLYQTKNYEELIKLYTKVINEPCKPKAVESSTEKLHNKALTLQIETWEKMGPIIEGQFSAFLSNVLFAYIGCGICKQSEKTEKMCHVCKVMACEKCLDSKCILCQNLVCKNCKKTCSKCNTAVPCKNCVPLCSKCNSKMECEKCEIACQTCKKCFKCLEKCEKCENMACMKCHPAKCIGKYCWLNGTDTVDRVKLGVAMTSTKASLPRKSFKIELFAKDFAAGNCWGIGITGKCYDGSYVASTKLPGYNAGLGWTEYGWSPCSCHHDKNFNGSSCTAFAKAVVTGKITLILDEKRNLNVEIDGVSQGVLFSNIVESEYWLTFGSTNTTQGELKIVSVTGI